MEKKKSSLEVLKLSEVKEETQKWLIPGFIPQSEITMIAGDGGCGKTTVWCAIAAAVSSGSRVFFEPAPEEFARGREPEKVLFFSSEDSVPCVLLPRLRKAGANLNNLLTVDIADPRFKEITFTSDLLEQMIKENKPSLVIFDPIQAFLPPKTQMGSRNEMRTCTDALMSLGAKYGTTFIIIVHTNKRENAHGRNRIADSADLWDSARSVMVVGKTKDKGIRYISHEKTNYGIPEMTVLFKINDTAEFYGRTENKDEDFVRERNDAKNYSPKRDKATDFILNYISNGKKQVKELEAAAKAEGISDATLRRAKKELKDKNQITFFQKGSNENKAFYIGALEQSHPDRPKS